MQETHTPARMLVVDDDPRSRKLLEGYLRSEGYAVQAAPDGPTALELVTTDNGRMRRAVWPEPGLLR